MRLSFHPLALGAFLLAGSAAFAQQPPPSPPATPGAPASGMHLRGPAGAIATAETTLSARIQRWLANPNGEVDGLLLSDGTQVAFAPHWSASLLQTAKVGDTVEVTGTRVPNVPLMVATRIQVGGKTLIDQPPVPGARPPAPPAAIALTALSASGKVARLLYTPRGDTRGVLLDTDSVILFPPHRGAELAPILQPGSSVVAKGWGTRGAQGVAMEATAIGASAETMRELFTGPGMEPRPDGLSHKAPGSHGPRGQRGQHGPGGPRAHHPLAPQPGESMPAPAGAVPPAPAS